jgi:hypothetical protein
MKLLLTIRTANRAPKTNYLGQTVRSLLGGGVQSDAIHVVSHVDDFARIVDEIGVLARCSGPYVPLSPNANGLAQVDLLDVFPADWIVMSEDDLEWCADPLGSIARWLEDYATPDRMIYRFFAFDKLTPVSAHAATAPLREMRGSQVVALRADDARRFAAWARQHPLDWRPKGAPFQDRPHDGFDKLLGYWALQDRPAVTTGLVSRPFFVRHLGTESSIHSRGVRMDHAFGGAKWSYRAEVPA